MNNNILGIGLAFLMGGIVTFGALVFIAKWLVEIAMSAVFDDVTERDGFHADSKEKEITDDE